MNVFGAFVFLAGSLLGAQHSSAQATSTSPLTAVDNVDLRRYAGKWYEIARYPNRFQRNCQSDTTANRLRSPADRSGSGLPTSSARCFTPSRIRGSLGFE